MIFVAAHRFHFIHCFSLLCADDKDRLPALYSANFREALHIELQNANLLTEKTLSLVIIGTK
ncbi:hypothetical protein VCHE48_1122 [Vibrio cholerae HE48]|nr:hypothetical protein VCHE48_1122 [Vibrio cholerae HE48]